MRILLLIFLFFWGLLSEVYANSLVNVLPLSGSSGRSYYGITSMYQDEFGFIWVGSKEGLSRYDGKVTEIFQPSFDEDNFRDDNVRNICGDKNGKLFIRGHATVSVFDLRTYMFSMLRKGGVSAIHYGHDALWIADSQGISKYNPQTGETTIQFYFNGITLPAMKISCFCIDTLGNFHVSTGDKGYYQLNNEGDVIRHIPIQEAHTMLYDTEGRLWICTRFGGLYCIGKRGVLTHYQHSPQIWSISHNNVRDIKQLDKNRFYVGTMNGVSLLDAETGFFRPYEYNQLENSSLSVVSLLLDKQKTLWVGTPYNGIFRYNSEYDIFHHYGSSANTSSSTISGIISSVQGNSHGTIWVGTERGGVYQIDRNTSSDGGTTKRISSLLKNSAKTLYFDSLKNVMWIASTNRGLCRYDISTRSVIYVAERILDDSGHIETIQNIVGIVPYNKDTLLLATNRGVAVLNRQTLRLSRLNVDYASSHRLQVWAIFVDNPRNIWITSSSGLYRYDAHNRTTKRYMLRDIMGNRVNNHLNYIVKDSDDNLWFGSTGSGIFRYIRGTDKFKNYNVEHGLSNDYITGIAKCHRQPALIISTLNGISRFNLHRESFENYNTQNGYPFSVTNEGSLHVTDDDEIFICGIGQMISVDNKDLRIQRHDYNLFLSSIMVDNNLVEPLDSTGILLQSALFQKKITLKPSNASVSFNVFSNNYLNASQSHVVYMLKGFDNDFHKLSSDSYVTYTNLNHGKYTFIAKGTLPDSNGNYPQITAELTVIPPFYKSIWFIILILLLTLWLGYYLFMTYVTRLKLQTSIDSEKRESLHREEVNQSKFRFFTNISHEFRTPLTLINGHLEMLLKKRDLNPSVYSSILAAYKDSLRMRRLVDEIIDIRKQEQGYLKLKVREQELSGFVRAICLHFEIIARKNRVNFRFELSDSPIMLFFDGEQLEKVIYNLLSNAFKYTKSGDSVEVKLKNLENEVQIEISDSGVGIAPEHVNLIFDCFYQDDKPNEGLGVKGSGIGLYLAKAVVEMHEGTIGVESEVGCGSLFRVTLPKTRSFSNPNVVLVSGESEIDTITTDLSQEELPITADEANIDKSTHILIVEDNDAVRDMLVQIFEFTYKVSTASYGEEGISKIAQSQPDIVLSDVMMPGMSGIEMCSRLKRNPETSHIPIVLLTARNAEEHIVEGLQMGADDYITKPFSVKLLVARCNNLVSGRRMLQQKYRQEPMASVQMLTTNAFDLQLFTRAEEIVSRHMVNADFNINEFSTEMGMSRSSLFTKIKGLTGLSPNEFIMSIRLKRAACRLLENPDEATLSIAYDLGFSSPSYFTKCFRLFFGETPKAYRNKMLSKNAVE